MNRTVARPVRSADRGSARPGAIRSQRGRHGGTGSTHARINGGAGAGPGGGAAGGTAVPAAAVYAVEPRVSEPDPCLDDVGGHLRQLGL